MTPRLLLVNLLVAPIPTFVPLMVFAVVAHGTPPLFHVVTIVPRPTPLLCGVVELYTIYYSNGDVDPTLLVPPTCSPTRWLFPR